MRVPRWFVWMGHLLTAYTLAGLAGALGSAVLGVAINAPWWATLLGVVAGAPAAVAIWAMVTSVRRGMGNPQTATRPHSTTGTEAESEGVTWRHVGGWTQAGPQIAPYCKLHGVYFLFGHNRTGGVEKPRDHHVISRQQGYYPTTDYSGALFCGDGRDGGHRVYFDTDPRNYGQAFKIAQPLIQARINRGTRNT